MNFGIDYYGKAPINRVELRRRANNNLVSIKDQRYRKGQPYASSTKSRNASKANCVS